MAGNDRLKSDLRVYRELRGVLKTFDPEEAKKLPATRGVQSEDPRRMVKAVVARIEMSRGLGAMRNNAESDEALKLALTRSNVGASEVDSLRTDLGMPSESVEMMQRRDVTPELIQRYKSIFES